MWQRVVFALFEQDAAAAVAVSRCDLFAGVTQQPLKGPPPPCPHTRSFALTLVRTLQARRERLQQEQPDKAWPQTHYVIADEEQLPLAPGSVDVVISCLGLHWANDLPVGCDYYLSHELFVI